MKKFFVLLVLGLMLVSIAQAELLTTANPLGQGKWAVEGFGVQDSNVQGQSSDWKMTVMGAYAGYGVTDKMDLYLSYGSGSLSGQPAGLGAITGSVIGVNGKYSIMDEASGAPVSVAAGLGYRTTAIIAGPFAGGNYNVAQMSAGVGVSKLFVPFIPYAALAYRSNAVSIGGGNQDDTQLDITVGTGIAWSRQGAVFVEYTSQSITPKVGSNFSSVQMALGVAYIL